MSDVAYDPLLTVRRRRSILLVLGLTLGLAMVVVATVLAVSDLSGGERGILVGDLTSDRIGGVALVACFGSIAAGLCLIPVSGWVLAVLVLARVVAIGATLLTVFAWWMTSSVSVVPLMSEGCDTGYLVEERSFMFAATGTVYRREGLLITRVERTSADDGYHPFADNAYVAVDDGTSIQVWYNGIHTYEGGAVSTFGEPAFTIPTLTRATEPHCEPEAGSAPLGMLPSPAPSTPPVADSRASLQEMLAVSVVAAVAPVVDAAGRAIDLPGLTPISTACAETGAQLGTALSFRTPDNAQSVRQILAVWDAAGYAPDRAMQEDIRYSNTLPVARMSIRDKSTIDGLIHMSLTTTCAAVR